MPAPPAAPSATKTAPGTPTKATRNVAGFAEVTLPERYGAVYVTGPDGTEKEYRGGQRCIVPVKQAKSLGILPGQDAAAADQAPSPADAVVEQVGKSPQ